MRLRTPRPCVVGTLIALAMTGVACAVAVRGYGGVVGHSPSMAVVVGQALLYCSVLVRFGTLTRHSAELIRTLREEQTERARRAVDGGDALFAPSITRRLIEAFARQHGPARDAAPPDLGVLTSRDARSRC
ncbi:hypothetical protein [Streptomyces sp. NPDC096311]|uniref:hypothetical protein n=1 Tax=Streptomyces sp. NPDC096311 TaxID=3366083 RepID=UPI003800073F